MNVKYFLIGLIMIFSGIFLEIGYPSVTGSFIGPRNDRFGFGLVVFLSGLPILFLSVLPHKGDSEIEKIKSRIETYHQRKLPEIDVVYSDNVYKGHVVHPLEDKEEYDRIKEGIILETGLSESETKQLDTKKYTIILPTKEGVRREILLMYRAMVKFENTDQIEDVKRLASFYKYFDVAIYGTKWHEMGHILCDVYEVKNYQIKEGISIAYEFKGLVLGAKEGRIPVNKAIDTIEETARQCQISCPDEIKLLRKYNPSLDFCNKDLEELILELDRTIDYGLSLSKKKETVV